MFQVGVSSIQGGRDYQEDSYAVTDPMGSDREVDQLHNVLLLVADGVGGSTDGAAASQLACLGTAVFFQAHYLPELRSGDISDLFLQSIPSLNSQFNQTLQKNPEYSGMATTLVAALVSGRELHWLSIGDSHLYLLRDGRLNKLNQDHSLGAYLDKQAAYGEISAEAAAGDPRRHHLLSYIDGGDIDEADVPDQAFPLLADDFLLLATDGVNTLSAEEMIEIATAQQDAQAIAEAITHAIEAKHNEGQDNATVVVLRLYEQ
ncbi:MAG: PP2C family protein-serine/threonine phosphatase [Methylobacter sp.]